MNYDNANNRAINPNQTKKSNRSGNVGCHDAWRCRLVADEPAKI